MKKYIHKITVILTIVSIVGLLESQAGAVCYYNIVDLGTLGGPFSQAKGINDLGQVVGWSEFDASGKQHAFLYDNGKMIDLGTLGCPNSGCADEGRSEAWGINNSGQIVGRSDGHAFLYENGFMTDLGTLGGTTSRAYDINNSGQIVGDSDNAQTYDQAFLYSEGTMQGLGSNFTHAWGVNDAGVIVGNQRVYVDDTHYRHASLYDGSAWNDLGTLDGFTGSLATDINNFGQAIGYAERPDAKTEAFLYDRASMSALGFLGEGDTSWAYGINDSDQIVGYSNTSISSGLYHPFLYDNATMYDLNDLIPANSEWSFLQVAWDINESGQIIGTGIKSINGRNRSHAFLMTPAPVPEPSTLLLLAFGLVGLSGFRRRFRKR